MNTSQFKKYLTPKNVGVFGVAVIIIVVVILSILLRKEEQAPSSEAPLAEKPRCIPTPGTGKQTYNIMRDKPNGFEITQVDVDPIDVEEGQAQTIRVIVKDKSKNATTTQAVVSAHVFTDSRNTAAAAFTLLSHENSKGSLLSTWESSWTRDDSVCRTYMETITASNNKGGESKVDLSFK